MTIGKDDSEAVKPEQAASASKPRWETPALEVLPIEMTANSRTNPPQDGTFAPNVS